MIDSSTASGEGELSRLRRFGWRGAENAAIGRVVSAHGDYYHLICNETEGEILARKKKSAFAVRNVNAVGSTGNGGGVVRNRKMLDSEIVAPLTPITGDFVRFEYNKVGESRIIEVVPRYSHFERKDPTARRCSQTLAVNFDTLFIMMSLNANFSMARLERFLALAEDIGEAEAVVVLTKADLLSSPMTADEAEAVAAVEDAVKAAGRRMLVISCVDGRGIDEVRRLAAPGRTLAFIGSSGVGKSTLLNTLAGEEWAATQEIQEWSGKGRHTTTSRELVMLPCGAMIIDTPGVREIGMLGESEAVQVKGMSSHRYRK